VQDEIASEEKSKLLAMTSKDFCGRAPVKQTLRWTISKHLYDPKKNN